MTLAYVVILHLRLLFRVPCYVLTMYNYLFIYFYLFIYLFSVIAEGKESKIGKQRWSSFYVQSLVVSPLILNSETAKESIRNGFSTTYMLFATQSSTNAYHSLVLPKCKTKTRLELYYYLHNMYVCMYIIIGYNFKHIP